MGRERILEFGPSLAPEARPLPVRARQRKRVGGAQSEAKKKSRGPSATLGMTGWDAREDLGIWTLTRASKTRRGLSLSGRGKEKELEPRRARQRRRAGVPPFRRLRSG